MDTKRKTRAIGNVVFGLSGLLSISSSVMVSLLRERYAFDYAFMGTLLAAFNIGTFVVGYAAGFLAAKLGLKTSSLLLAPGYLLGYILLAIFKAPALLLAGFFLIGAGRGMGTNTCNVMVGENAEDKTKSLNLLHAFYAMGALLSPVCAMVTLAISPSAPAFFLAILSIFPILLLHISDLSNEKKKKEGSGEDFSFLKSKSFLLLTLLIFCQNAAETAVVGWVVTYYQDTGILSGTIANYAITVIWAATLVGRLFVAFVLPIKSPPKAMAVMGILTACSYLFLVNVHTGLLALVALSLFAVSLAGVNPTAVSCAGKELNPLSLSIMLPTASLGQILMPWVIGQAAEKISLPFGMVLVLIPCVILTVAALLFSRLSVE
ncbi:MAG: MFS transporter [Lachnospiraceae bacterium]|nr:MFS transporter [Lachnospiraceae bacterium]